MFTPQLADIDGDGRLDLLSGSSCCQDPMCFYVFRRRPDGTFGPRERVNLDYPVSEFSRLQEFPINGLKSRIAVADWNGDGKPDVLVGGYGMAPLGVIFDWSPKRPATVRRLGPKGEGAINFMTTNPCLVDWDGDGLLDLVCGTAVNAAGKVDSTGRMGVYWFQNLGTKREPKLGPARLLVPDGSRRVATGIAVADWNGDGRLDLIISRKDYKGAEGFEVEHHKILVYLRNGQ
jgi:hypothetical protein